MSVLSELINDIREAESNTEREALLVILSDHLTEHAIEINELIEAAREYREVSGDYTEADDPIIKALAKLPEDF